MMGGLPKDLIEPGREKDLNRVLQLLAIYTGLGQSPPPDLIAEIVGTYDKPDRSTVASRMERMRKVVAVTERIVKELPSSHSKAPITEKELRAGLRSVLTSYLRIFPKDAPELEGLMARLEETLQLMFMVGSEPHEVIRETRARFKAPKILPYEASRLHLLVEARFRERSPYFHRQCTGFLLAYLGMLPTPEEFEKLPNSMPYRKFLSSTVEAYLTSAKNMYKNSGNPIGQDLYMLLAGVPMMFDPLKTSQDGSTHSPSDEPG